MKMNIAWHTTHPMPRKATFTQRVAWHREHAKHCACRPMPADIEAAIKKKRASRAKSTEKEVSLH